MAKVLFLNGPSMGDTAPTLGLVSELIKYGESVSYFSSVKYRKLIEKTGATFFPIPDFFSVPGFAENADIDVEFNLSTMTAAFTEVQYMDIYLGAVIQAIKNKKFDYIIHDSAFGCGYEMGQLLQLPRISSCTMLAPLGNINPVDSNTGSEFRKALFTEPWRSLKWWYKTRKVEGKYGVRLTPFKDYYFIKGDLTVVYTSKFFQPYCDQADDSFVFVGASLEGRETMVDFPFEKLEGEAVVYVSFGTQIQKAKADFFKTVIGALKDMNLIVVCSVGEDIDLSQLGDLPANFIVRNRVPQLEILKRSSLFISHGGMNSVTEALYYNTPLIIVPMYFDQFYQADRACELGAACSLRREDLSSDRLAAAVSEVLSNNSYQENARKVGESLRESGGSKKAAEAVLEFVENKRHCLDQ